jgi:hypothetical protein
MEEQARLDRIESKIDKMSEAIIALARAEEKISGLDETTHIILKRLVAYEERLRIVEEQSVKSKTVVMLFWIIASAIVASVVGAIKWL